MQSAWWKCDRANIYLQAPAGSVSNAQSHGAAPQDLLSTRAERIKAAVCLALLCCRSCGWGGFPVSPGAGLQLGWKVHAATKHPAHTHTALLSLAVPVGHTHTGQTGLQSGIPSAKRYSKEIMSNAIKIGSKYNSSLRGNCYLNKPSLRSAKNPL